MPDLVLVRLKEHLITGNVPGLVSGGWSGGGLEKYIVHMLFIAKMKGLDALIKDMYGVFMCPKKM